MIHAGNVIVAAGLVALGVTLMPFGAAALDDAAMKERSARLAGELQSELKEKLEAALAEGTPAEAIEVCHSIAPEIAARLSKESGAVIRRTSMRVRNPSNAADAWEAEKLAEFARQAAAGADMSKVSSAEVVTIEGQSAYRFMKPIMMGKLCATCHGTSVDPAVKAAIAAIYPNDQGTGFVEGELRGAFSVTWPSSSQ